MKNLLDEIFSEDSNFSDPGNSLTGFPFRITLKIHKICTCCRGG